MNTAEGKEDAIRPEVTLSEVPVKLSIWRFIFQLLHSKQKVFSQ